MASEIVRCSPRDPGASLPGGSLRERALQAHNNMKKTATPLSPQTIHELRKLPRLQGFAYAVDCALIELRREHPHWQLPAADATLLRQLVNSLLDDESDPSHKTLRWAQHVDLPSLRASSSLGSSNSSVSATISAAADAAAAAANTESTSKTTTSSSSVDDPSGITHTTVSVCRDKGKEAEADSSSSSSSSCSSSKGPSATATAAAAMFLSKTASSSTTTNSTCAASSSSSALPSKRSLVDGVAPSLGVSVSVTASSSSSSLTSPFARAYSAALRSTTEWFYDRQKLAEHVVQNIVPAFLKQTSSVPSASTADSLLWFPSKRFAYQVACSTLIGARTSNEDEYVSVPSVNELYGVDTDVPHAVFGVYDGHSGKAASEYARAFLHEQLVAQSNFLNDPSAAMNTCFLKIDSEINVLSQIECTAPGTTALLMLIRNDQLIFGNVGDTQAVLSRNGIALEMVNAHSPNRIDERERILSMGGSVVWWYGTWRVNGTLAVSRSLGDLNHEKVCVAEPEVTEFNLIEQDEFVIIASDGLWDVMLSQEAVDFVHECLRSQELPRACIADALAKEALRLKSRDNVTVVIVFVALRDKVMS